MTNTPPYFCADDVIATDELERRPSRTPDHEAESHAFRCLVEIMATKPEGVLQRLVELTMGLTRAGSAGISLLEPGGAHGIFRWVAATGACAPFLNGTIPREASPCGEVIARDAVLLMKAPERAFPALLQAQIGIEEGLLAPFHVDGKPVGTLWAIKHGADGGFEREDARLIQSLSRFAAAAHQMILALSGAQAGRRESEEKYRALFQSIDEGFAVIEFPSESEEPWEDFRFVEVNAAFERQIGKQDIAGKLGSEINPGSDAVWIKMFGDVARTGEAKRLEIRHNATGRWYDVYATRIGGAESRQVCVVFADTTERRENEARLASELSGTQLLQRLSTRLIPEQPPEALHEQILEAALELMQADAVSIQLLDDRGDRLRRLATRNLHPQSTGYWTWVDASHASTCGQALRKNSRVVSEDVEASAELAGTGDLEAFRSSGTRAVQSTPLVTRAGKPIGMISTHWRQPRKLADSDFGLFDILARQVADLLERSAIDAALRESEERQAFLLQLSDALRPLREPLDIQTTAMKLLAERLGVMRAGYYEVASDQDAFVLTAKWERRSARPLVNLRLGDFGADVGGEYRGGHTLILRDIERDDVSAETRATYRAIGVQARVGVPLVKEGRLLTVVAVHSETARDWTAAEVRMIEDVAERTWATVERARAESSLRESEQRYRALVTTGAYSIYRMSPDWRLMYQLDSETLATTSAPIENWVDKYIPAKDRPAVNAAIEQAIRDKSLFELEHRVHLADGGLGWVMSRAVPLLGPDGAITEWFGAGSDVTERKRAEAALSESEERLRQFGEASQDVLWIRDAETLQWQYLTPAFEMIYGISREDALAGNNYRSWLDLIIPEDRERAMDGIRRVRGGDYATFEFRIKRPSDGTIRWMRNTDFPITDASGKVVLIGGIGHDATDLKRAQERQDTLLAELQHRVRNILAVTHSIVSRSNDGERDTEGYVQHLQGRISALARTQVLLTRKAGAGVDLEDLIHDELLAQVASDEQFALAGPDVQLSAKAAEVLTLAIHELATNATKYGAFSRADGRLEVRWSVEERDDRHWLVLDWSERGVPIVDAAPRRRGFGAELVSRRIPYELKGYGQFELKPGGMRSHIEFPLVAGDSILQTDGVSR